MVEQYCIRSKITPEVFREFALFDTFRRQKRYQRPALFALIMILFAAICFAREFDSLTTQKYLQSLEWLIFFCQI